MIVDEARRAVSLLASLACVGLVAVTTTATRPTPAPQGSRGAAPRVVYSTLLGGAAGNFDGAYDLAVDAAGNAYVVGTTESSDFPVQDALQPTMKGNSDAFVAKFAPDGSLVFSTFLGGAEREGATAVAFDASGAIYVAGHTASSDFPRKNALQPAYGGALDAFVTKLAPDGASIVWSTFLGGNGTDVVRDMIVDRNGNVYVAGEVQPASGGAATFPTVNAAQPEYGGGPSDAFVSLISADGGELIASTFLDAGIQSGEGRPGRDVVSTMRVLSGSSDAYIAGYAELDEDEDEIAFVGRIRLSTNKLLEPQLSIPILFGVGREYLEHPELRGYKLTRGMLLAYPQDKPGGLRPQGGAAGEVTMLAEGLCRPESGGTCNDIVSLVRYDRDLVPTAFANLPLLNEFFLEYPVADSQGAIYIAGSVSSNRLPTVNPLQATFGGLDDVVVAVLEPGTLESAMVTYFGGDGVDTPTCIATDAAGNIYVTGITTVSTVFPTTPGALQEQPKGRNDGFLFKISALGPFPDAPDFSLSFDPSTIEVSRGTKITVPLAIDRVGGFTGRVRVTSPAAAPGFKLPKKAVTVEGGSAALKIKIKPDAPVGPTSFTFTGTDAEGRARSATVTLVVQ